MEDSPPVVLEHHVSAARQMQSLDPNSHFGVIGCDITHRMQGRLGWNIIERKTASIKLGRPSAARPGHLDMVSCIFCLRMTCINL